MAKAKREPLTDEQILSAIKAEEETAIGSGDGIASERQNALDRYLGRSNIVVPAGRSAVVSRDVSDVVEGVLANVLKPFVSGDKLCQFEPSSAEDEAQAEQETDYINFIALERNNGFVVLYSAIKNALLLRNGYVGASWRVRDDVRLEQYQGQSDDELAMLAKDGDVEIVAHSEYPASMPDGSQMLLHDVQVRRKAPVEYCEIYPIPPSELFIGERTRDPGTQNTDFIQWRKRVSLSYLREQGYEVADDISDDDEGQDSEEQTRQRGQSGGQYDDETGDPARRLVTFKETWIMLDRDADGIAELLKVCQVGQTALAIEETDIVPIASGTGVVMQHQHLGLSIDDMVADVADLKTALLRNYMDGKYLSTNGRTAVDEDRVNIADLMVSRPGGIVRTEGPPANSIMAFPFEDTGASALQGLEYLDSVRENRTGYTRLAQGLDADSLVNKTATGYKGNSQQSQTRLEMIARTLAETLVRDLFRVVHAMTLKHANKAEKVRLRNKWVTVDPRTWVKRTDLSISVGLGVGTGDQQLAKLQALAPMLAQAGNLGLAGQQEFYSFGVEVLKAAGYKNPDRFIHPPPMGPDGKPLPAPPPPKDPMVQAQEVRSQADAQKAQAERANDAQKFQAEQAATAQRLQMEDSLKQRALAGQLEVQKANDERDAAIKVELHQREIESRERIASLQSQTSIAIARISSGMDEKMAAAQGAADSVMQASQGLLTMLQEAMAQLGASMNVHAQAMAQHAAMANAPKRIVRDPVSGKAIGVEPVRTIQ